MKELSKEQKEQIEKEAEDWRSKLCTPANHGCVAYTAAATKYLLQSIDNIKKMKTNLGMMQSSCDGFLDAYEMDKDCEVVEKSIVIDFLKVQLKEIEELKQLLTK